MPAANRTQIWKKLDRQLRFFMQNRQIAKGGKGKQQYAQAQQQSIHNKLLQKLNSFENIAALYLVIEQVQNRVHHNFNQSGRNRQEGKEAYQTG